MTTRIVGIDPGLHVTGYGVIDVEGRTVQVVEAGVIRGTASRTLPNRVSQIHEGVADVLGAFRPQCMALEELYSHYQRPRTAILMGHARGVVCLAASQANVDVSHYAATQVKRILTGNGRAPKDQVQLAVQRELGLSAVPEPNDVADALALALCHLYLGMRDPLSATSTVNGMENTKR